MHCMIDIETIGITHDAVILSVGMVRFDPFSSDIDKSFYLKPDVDAQLAMGRVVDEDTLNWWAKQKPEITEEAFNGKGRISLKQFVKDFRKAIANCDKIWAKGPTFDTIILENFFKSMHEPCPWSYSNIRDARTLYDFADHTAPNIDAHDPVSDCVIQILVVQQVYKKFSWLKLQQQDKE